MTEIKYSQKTFAELTAEELYEILRVRSDVFIVEQNCAYPDIDGIDRFSMHLYGTEDGKIVSYLRIYPKEKGIYQIGRVLTAVRGKGYGSEILQRGIDWISQREDARSVYIEAQCYAEGFYEKAGFRVSSEEFLEDGIPHAAMILDLEKNDIMQKLRKKDSE